MGGKQSLTRRSLWRIVQASTAFDLGLISDAMKTIVTLCMAAAMFASACSPSSTTMPSVVSTVYVLLPPPEAASFTTVLASVVKKHGMSANVGQATDDKGSVLNVLDAESDGLRLRSENVPLSGQEDPAQCGVHTEPYSDPGQYFISISSTSEAAARQAARALLLGIGEDLKAAGYVVRSTSVICSGSAKR